MAEALAGWVVKRVGIRTHRVVDEDVCARMVYELEADQTVSKRFVEEAHVAAPPFLPLPRIWMDAGWWW